ACACRRSGSPSRCVRKVLGPEGPGVGATQAGDGVADAGPPMGGAGRVDGPAMLRWMMRCVVVFALMSGVSHSSGAVRYVRAGGNNALDGDSPETAWATVAYAAARVAP